MMPIRWFESQLKYQREIVQRRVPAKKTDSSGDSTKKFIRTTSVEKKTTKIGHVTSALTELFWVADATVLGGLFRSLCLPHCLLWPNGAK